MANLWTTGVHDYAETRVTAPVSASNLFRRFAPSTSWPPNEMRPLTTVEFFVGDEKGLRVTGVFDVSVPIAQRRNPDPVNLEAAIATAIRACWRRARQGS